MIKNSRSVLIDTNPGRNSQTYGIARELGTEQELIHEPSVGVIGNKGDSQCYLGVLDKVQSIHNVLRSRIGITGDKLKLRLVQPEFTVATSDGIRNGTKEMRYSLIGREITNDSLCEHLSASGLEGLIAVVACDKPPVGTISAILEHNRPAIIMSDGSIRPGVDSLSGEAIDIISSYQIAGSDDEGLKRRIAMESCPGFGSCGGMFTYNTMQTFLGVLGMEPLDMVAPASQDQRRHNTFPEQLVDYLANLISKNLTPRDIVTRGSIRNAIIVSMAVGGSTNVMLHAPEIARAAGYGDFYKDIMSVEEFNHLSENVVPVIVNARPFGKYSMVDIDSKGGVQVFVKDLLDAGLIDGDLITCTGETLAEQVDRLKPPQPDGTVIYSVKEPFKPTGGLRLLGGNLSPDASAVLKLAGVEGGLDNNIFTGRARVFDGEQALLEFLDTSPNELSDSDMVIVRYEGPVGGPGMPEMLDSTSRITTICREKNIVVGLMTDGRFSGGSVGLVIGHVGPEAAAGGPIGLLENGDTIEVNLDKNELNCKQLDDPHTYKSRQLKWESKLDENSNIHPAVGEADTRLLNRMRCSAVSAVYGAGMHPNGSLWVSNPRKPEVSNFLPKNKFK
ncbi:dihydroxy-acid dehydratase [Alphaproteobacteria bacterium]|nr:dihydroxy-acid dehydratase [Alphaproteobacteria bacterium]